MSNLALEAFARQFLDPEVLGLAVSPYTRDQARLALGRVAVESSLANAPQCVAFADQPHQESTMPSDTQTEAAIVAAGANVAPRITPADVEANIVSEDYFTAAEGCRKVRGLYPLTPLEMLTFCVLTLRNGFTVTGESACASPENFNSEIGRKIARQNAVAKIWPLMGYELRTRIAEGHTTIADRTVR